MGKKMFPDREDKKRGWKKRIGDLGEKIAGQYLQDTEGYQILGRNYRCPIGEIDLICRDEEYLVFVEIRSSSSESMGMAAESIGYRKQRKLRQLAQYYLIQERLDHPLCRFDVVLLLLDEERQSARELLHLKNAFY